MKGRVGLTRVHERACLRADLRAGYAPQCAVEGHASGDGEGEVGRGGVARACASIGSQPVAYWWGLSVVLGSVVVYCGHQFGYFSGQLGDGAAMLLGQVIKSSLSELLGRRWLGVAI